MFFKYVYILNTHLLLLFSFYFDFTACVSKFSKPFANRIHLSCLGPIEEDRLSSKPKLYLLMVYNIAKKRYDICSNSYLLGLNKLKCILSAVG
jgi:hypothetical protein